MKRLFLFLTTLIVLTSAQAKSLKVLFVGNSYTYVGAMPEILRTMAEAKGHELIYEQQTPGGRSFQQHWEEKKAVEKMKAGNFDVIVLQNQSFEPVGDPEKMMKYGKLLAAEVDKSGAEKLYYLTMAYNAPVKWMQGDSEEARKGIALLPQMHERLVESYTRLANETEGRIAPVGIAWKLAYESNPDLQLHSADHSHPTTTGAYLTSLVFYSTLFDEEASDMPGELTVEMRKKDKIKFIKIKLDAQTRKTLEAAAKAACKE
ncbi:SGNH/GDSL hydrolase family protein [Pontiella sulfatireligans]|uniref:SGNH hydrolase-type esterase domain-containing protein n=1 Tax=Pontiella sulfatireligans TaxID=2750658 RepID=A0A6C2USW4_9BACT|nr:hypothetical protein [Pontiella sulfatireligans]VGO23053.1 hypothetical protein SCARR_05152 [Pontiella sulfatireligans]